MADSPTKRVLTPDAIGDLPDVGDRLAAVADFLDYVTARGKAGRALRRDLIAAARTEGWTKRQIAARLRVTETAVKQIMRGTIW